MISTWLPPWRRTSVCFTSGVERGMKMVARQFRTLAARATPCAWLPADAATIPLSLASWLRAAMQLYAPRHL